MRARGRERERARRVCEREEGMWVCAAAAYGMSLAEEISTVRYLIQVRAFLHSSSVRFWALLPLRLPAAVAQHYKKWYTSWHLSSGYVFSAVPCECHLLAPCYFCSLSLSLSPLPFPRSIFFILAAYCCQLGTRCSAQKYAMTSPRLISRRRWKLHNLFIGRRIILS